MTAKILTIDIETFPISALVWGLFDQNIGIEQIETEWSIASYAAKWLGKREMIYADTSGRGPGKVRDDKPLMKGLWNLLDEADLIVAQNGKRFDVKKINARLVEHGFGPYSPIRVIDTLVVSKKTFGFTSNKMAWTGKHIAKRPKLEHRRFPGIELWKECLKDNPKAWRDMKTYNCEDVRVCEQKYKVLRPWISNHPNLGVYIKGHDRPLCPHCGSARMIVDKHRLLAKQQGAYVQYKCGDCGSYARGKTMQLPLEKRRSLLVPE